MNKTEKKYKSGKLEFNLKMNITKMGIPLKFGKSLSPPGAFFLMGVLTPLAQYAFLGKKFQAKVVPG